MASNSKKTHSNIKWILLGIVGVLVAITYNRYHISKHIDPFVPEDWQYRKLEEKLQETLRLNLVESLPPFIKDLLNRDLSKEVDGFVVGSEMHKEGLRMKHPVILVPGIAASALEAWSTSDSDCGRNYFRKRMWGTLSQLQALLLDKQCWLSHMQLDPKTGLDPKDVRLRASSGLEATDYLFPGYWLMAKLISNIAAIGGDSNTLQVAPYDWRLSFPNLEKRDLFFTKLKAKIEHAYGLENKKVYLVCHSMGNLIQLYFMNWVQSPLGGRKNAQWIEQHIAGWVNIAGPLLGTPKALAPMLSGETRDSAQLDPYASQIVERLLARNEIQSLFHSFDGVATLFPKGGSKIWGFPGEHIPDAPEHFDHNHESSSGVSFRKENSTTFEQVTIEEAVQRVYDIVDPQAAKRWKKSYDLSYTNKVDPNYLEKPETWANPLLAPLPKFQYNNFKMFCFYGVGLPTERSYYYNQTGSEYQIDNQYFNEDSGISHGVQDVDGDGTVPLLSAGYMCRRGWHSKHLNPSGIKIVVKERKNLVKNPALEALLRSPTNVDHVDILGNNDVIRDILLILGGKEQEIQNEIYSDIDAIAQRVDANLKN
ncbi:Lecithin:cholesterol acyltransferase-domain-containing protein [Gorgonomyces haynaldii]|nr:Lecithin:cholesterol acyltransferase-domain-containing protein [Gorgonomyces haynaldii]